VIEAIMLHTRLCPFGGGRNGRREACRYGHPGCACVDWLAQYEEKHETTISL
jgi:hypothetical protein